MSAPQLQLHPRAYKVGEVVLSVENVSLAFGGVQALREVSFDVREHEVRAIIGPNGAGKTTFFNLLSGQYRPTSGRVHFKGEDITRLGAAARTARGIGRSFQLTNVFPTASANRTTASICVLPSTGTAR